MTYIDFKLNYPIKPGVWIGNIPYSAYRWIINNVEKPDWVYATNRAFDFDENEFFKGINLPDDLAIIFKLKFRL